MPEDPIAALIARATAENISMARICDEAGVAQSTPSRWKNGSDPKLKTLRKLQSALDELISRPAE